jgi:hypothetical protein
VLVFSIASGCPTMFPACGLLSCAEVLADLEQPVLGIEVPHLHYWSNNGEFTQVRTRCWFPPHVTGVSVMRTSALCFNRHYSQGAAVA